MNLPQTLGFGRDLFLIAGGLGIGSGLTALLMARAQRKRGQIRITGIYTGPEWAALLTRNSFKNSPSADGRNGNVEPGNDAHFPAQRAFLPRLDGRSCLGAAGRHLSGAA